MAMDEIIQQYNKVVKIKSISARHASHVYHSRFNAQLYLVAA